MNKGHRPYMQQEEFKKAIAFAGDIVVIHLGINDTDHVIGRTIVTVS